MAGNEDSPTDNSAEQGISLDELAQAFAQVMGSGPKPKAGGTAAAASSPLAPAGEPTERGPSGDFGGSAVREPTVTDPAVAATGDLPDPAGADDRCPITPRTILEAMLFVGDRENRPLSSVRAAELMRGVEQREIPALVNELNQRYTVNGCPYCVANDSEGYRLALRQPFHTLRDRFYGRIRQARLSQAAIDILAIVAYQQPLTAEQISTMRGKPSSHVLSQLVHRGLLRIERKPGKRRIVQYFTTERFLQLFGLQTLADLPQSEELDRQ